MLRLYMKALVPIAAALLIIFAGYSDEAEARAGRSGGSFGYRGSRTYSAPVQQAPTRQQAATPQNPQTAQQAQPTAQQAYQRPGGLFGGLAGGLAGGLIGGLLFSSLGHAAAAPGASGGLGLLDIILIGVGIFLIIGFFRRKRSTEAFLGGRQPANHPATDELSAGIGDIRRMDAHFDEEHFMSEAIDIFFNVQAAWVRGDVERLGSIIAPQALETLRGEMESLKSRGLVNRVEGVAVKDAQITEAWQEKGTDFITLKMTASATDYLVDGNGTVVEGSSTEAVRFTEYWTFAREIGKDWRLSAIQQAA